MDGIVCLSVWLIIFRLMGEDHGLDNYCMSMSMSMIFAVIAIDIDFYEFHWFRESQFIASSRLLGWELNVRYSIATVHCNSSIVS